MRGLADGRHRGRHVAQVEPAAADPAVGDPAGPSQPGFRGRAEEDRRPRPLDRLGQEPRGRDVGELAVELHGVVPPERGQHPDGVLEARRAPVERDAERGELLRRPAQTEADVESTLGEHVERGELPGQQRGRDERGVDDGGPQPDLGGDGGGERECDDRVEHRAVLRTPVRLRRREQPLVGPQRAVAGLLGADGDALDVLRRRPRAGDGQPEPHHEITHHPILAGLSGGLAPWQSRRQDGVLPEVAMRSTMMDVPLCRSRGS